MTKITRKIRSSVQPNIIKNNVFTRSKNTHSFAINKHSIKLDLSKDLQAIFFFKEPLEICYANGKALLHFLNYFAGFTQAQSPSNIL